MPHCLYYVSFNDLFFIGMTRYIVRTQWALLVNAIWSLYTSALEYFVPGEHGKERQDRSILYHIHNGVKWSKSDNFP